MPESPALWKRFGAHRGSQGLGAIAVEFCCLFDLISRAPLRFVYSKVCTSEHKLIGELIQGLKKRDLLLLDAGFYYGTTLKKIRQRQAHFLIPTTKNRRPQVLQILGPGDYLCQIKNYQDKNTLMVRVVFVYRNGFRRRRLVTSLLDPERFPATELARLYHLRWDIETFYRDFKHTLRATSWHCQSPNSFHQELLMHLIAVCLIRLAMSEASHLFQVPVSQISFTRALTETRLFLKFLLAQSEKLLWPLLWDAFVTACAQHRVCIKPDRHFTRDRQEYRRKSRGLEKRRRGRPRKYPTPQPLPVEPETLNDSNNNLFLLS